MKTSDATRKLKTMQNLEIIRTYAFTQQFTTAHGIQTFGGHIHAHSFAEAEQLCRSFGAELDGELVESICENCGRREVFNEAGDDILDATQIDYRRRG